MVSLSKIMPMLSDCIRNNSEKRDSKNKSLLVFKPTFHETVIIFLYFSDVLAIYLRFKQYHRDFSYVRYENC